MQSAVCVEDGPCGQNPDSGWRQEMRAEQEMRGGP